MAVSLYVPLFQIPSGFGLLRLSLDPSHYGQEPGALPAAFLAPPAESEVRPLLASPGQGDQYVSSVPPSAPVSDQPAPTSIAPYVLEIISGRYQGHRIPLRANKPAVTVGSDSNADIVFIDVLVAKRHATLTLTDEGLFIEDLGSANGILVQGIPIKARTKIKAGDRILIGSSRIVVAVTTVSEPEQAPEAFRTEVSGPLNVPLFSGRFGKRNSLFGLLQYFQGEGMDGTLHVHGDQKGRLDLRRGRVIQATIDGVPQLSPLKAFFRITAWEKGAFEFMAAGDEEIQEVIQSSEGLMMESARQMDELAHIAPKLPSRSATLTLAQPFKKGGEDFTPAEIEVLELISSQGNTLQAVLDRAQSYDLDVCQALLSLIKKGCVRAS